ncbi:MAG: ComEC/Rec2 family competence protein [Phycisphaerales bacterium]|nr:MAG: ComEC/Rec2 family competence protein [Phycisphaerales bacterium]
MHLSSDNASGPSVAPARQRAFGALACFAIGIWGAHTLEIDGVWWLLAGVMLLSVAAALVHGRPTMVLLAAGVTLLGGVFLVQSTHDREAVRSREMLARLVGDGSVLTIDGVVEEDPRPARKPEARLAPFLHQGDSIVMPVSARRVVGDSASTSIRGRVWVVVERGGVRELPGAGAGVRITGRFSLPDEARNPGVATGPDSSDVIGTLASSSATLVLPRSDAIESTVDGWRAFAWRTRAALRARAMRVMDAACGRLAHDEPARAMLFSILLGQYEPGSDEVRGVFTRIGLAHVLAISGFHITVLAGVLLALLRLTGDRGWLEPVVVGVVVVLYAGVVPPASPINRAVAMVLLLLAAEAIGRRYDRLTMLLWIAMGMLVVEPGALWSLSYQLTILLTGVLFWLTGDFREILFGRPVLGVVTRRPSGPLARLVFGARETFSTTLMCALAATPIVIARTGLLSPLSAVVLVVISPLVLAVMILGDVALVGGMVVPALAEGIGSVLAPVARWCVGLAAWFDALPGSSFALPPVPMLWGVCASALIVSAVRRGSARRARWWMLAGVVGVWLGVAMYSGGLRSDVRLRVDSLSVGNGSCLVVRSGRDVVLWDAGGLGTGARRGEVLAACRALGAWRVPTVVVTHPDLDHFGELPELLRPLGVREVCTGERFVEQARERPDGAAGVAMAAFERAGVVVRVLKAGEVMRLGEVDMAILSPPGGVAWAVDNEHSIVAAIRRPGGSVSECLMLLTGDLQGEGVRHMTAAHPSLSAQIVEVPHHGSAATDSIAWVAGLRPRVTLQSTGSLRVNDPRWEVVRSRCAWLCTSVDGASWAEVRRDGSIVAGGVISGERSVPDGAAPRP